MLAKTTDIQEPTPTKAFHIHKSTRIPLTYRVLYLAEHTASTGSDAIANVPSHLLGSLQYAWFDESTCWGLRSMSRTSA